MKSIRLISFTFVPLVAHTKIERKAKEKNKKILSSYGPNISLRKPETLNGSTGYGSIILNLFRSGSPVAYFARFGVGFPPDVLKATETLNGDCDDPTNISYYWPYGSLRKLLKFALKLIW